MARYVATTIINSPLPMWDSFEAIFFVVAGVSVGIVIGVLFPSLWRSFRRGFRKRSRYAPLVEKWDDGINVKIKILPDDKEDLLHKKEENFFYVHVFEAFTAARYYFQSGNVRKAVSLYIEILTYEKVSKQDTNRALFELSQVYSFIGLFERAFDTALELLSRKPNFNPVLMHLLKICSQHFSPDKINTALNVYKGIPDAPLKRSLAHSHSRVCEALLKKQEIASAIEYARLAVKWDRTSGRALIRLWETTSRQFWQKNLHDKKIAWLSFAADLDALTQIFRTSKISSAAAADYLSHLIGELLSLPHSFENYSQVQKEFGAIFNWQKVVAPVQKKIKESLFYALLLLHKKYLSHEIQSTIFNETPPFAQEANRILGIVTQQEEAAVLNFFDYKKVHENSIFLGVFVHQCTQCQSLFPAFLWQCTHCELEESLFPVNHFHSDVVF